MSWKQTAQCAQLDIIDKEIEEVMDSITESSKISKTFHAEFLGISDKAEQKGNFELLSSGKKLKRNSKNNRIELANLKRFCSYSKRRKKII